MPPLPGSRRVAWHLKRSHLRWTSRLHQWPPKRLSRDNWGRGQGRTKLNEKSYFPQRTHSNIPIVEKFWLKAMWLKYIKDLLPQWWYMVKDTKVTSLIKALVDYRQHVSSSGKYVVAKFWVSFCIPLPRNPLFSNKASFAHPCTAGKEMVSDARERTTIKCAPCVEMGTYFVSTRRVNCM